jgi:hypothetical protein
MPVITGPLNGGSAPVITGAGAPAAGTAEVQTLTIGGTPTGGSFKLAFAGFTTAAIDWTATDATLVTRIDTALEALPTIGTGGVVVADTTLTSGIGAVTITWADKKVVPLITLASNDLEGTNPTVAIVETTPGVDPTGAGAGGNLPKGGLYVDTTNAILYINTGTALAPTWTKVGTQT